MNVKIIYHLRFTNGNVTVVPSFVWISCIAPRALWIIIWIPTKIVISVQWKRPRMVWIVSIPPLTTVPLEY